MFTKEDILKRIESYKAQMELHLNNAHAANGAKMAMEVLLRDFEAHEANAVAAK